MKLLHFLVKEARTPLRRLAVMAVVSGIANLLILLVINQGIQKAVDDKHSWVTLFLFLIATAIYIVSQRYLMVETLTEVEKILQRIQMRIADKIRGSDLEPLEVIGRAQIYSSLSRETQTISQASSMLMMALQAALLIFFAVFYIAYLSLAALFTFVAVSAIAVSIQFRNISRLEHDLGEAMGRENKMLDTLNHLLDGFIETKMNPRRSDDLYAHLGELGASAATLKIDTKRQLAKIFVFGNSMLYALVVAMIFVVPRLSNTYNEIIVQAATAMLFLFGPISTLVGAIPDFASAAAAIIELESLEEKLDTAASRRGGPPDAQMSPFEEIRLEGIVFRFHSTKSDRPFTLGPVDMSLHHGETLFVVGGNGSGKSTLLRLLTALYKPDQGSIRVDGTPVREGNLQAYRNLFSVIFTDFHLFDRLYGLGDTDETRLAALLEEMELAQKTRYRDGEFTTLDLSHGQRSRLAYIVSLLEDRPIYIFDEWAAGQDPEFRRRFYEQLLPELKERGKTILAVTHDDKYWHCADRRLKMEEGTFVPA